MGTWTDFWRSMFSPENDKHYEWLKKNFTEPEIVAYLKEKMSGR